MDEVNRHFSERKTNMHSSRLAGILPRKLRQLAVESLSAFQVRAMPNSLKLRCFGSGNTDQ